MYTKESEYKNKYSRLMFELKELNKEIYLNKGLKMAITTRFKKSWLYKKIYKNPLLEIKPFMNNKSNYFSENRIAIYTSIFGSYDSLNEPVILPDNCDFYVITDLEVNNESSWKKIHVNLDEYGLENENNVTKNRFFKMFPDKLFPEYSFSIYVDGNVKIITDLTEFINNMNSYGLSMHLHSSRKCIYKEINVCIKKKKDTKENLEKSLEHITKNGMPKEYGLLEAPVIVREHNNPVCKKIMNEWWWEFITYSRRDQLSLPYVLWKNNIRIEEIGTMGDNLFHDFAFNKYKHS